MIKKELLKLLKHVPDDANIGFRCSDLGKDCPADDFAYAHKTDEDDFARTEQKYDFVLVSR